MSQLMSDNDARYHAALAEWRARYADENGRRSSGLSPLLVGGLAVAGLGALAWYYLGPDLRRYLKLRDM
jgi:hypothetical protein